MKRIYKYDLELIIGIPQTIEIPLGAMILNVVEQHNGIVLYAIVDQQNKKSKEQIIIYATGREVDTVNTGEYIGTVSLNNGNLMFHVFIHNKEQ